MQRAFEELPPFTRFKHLKLRDYILACLAAVEFRDQEGGTVNYSELDGHTLYKNINGGKVCSSNKASKLFKSIARLLPQSYKDKHGVPRYKRKEKVKNCRPIHLPTMLII